ncbi:MULTISPECIES: hypothetical protein [unclassified Clostridium]|uniref:hypothetical protein n=1 Tax=unclassified Clostridium TaxID=2614128 RepID=UPI0025C0B295|nr:MULTISPECIES: hypothetical protein [unclassified Clostridium]
MFEILCYTKIGDKQIATLRTPIVPRIGEKIDINISDADSIYKTTGKICDIEYRFDRNSILKHILVFLDRG